MRGITTTCEIPCWEDPLQRFCDGVGELKLAGDGPAFTLWEALLHLEPQRWPLAVAGRTLARDEMLTRAEHLLDPDTSPTAATRTRLSVGEEGCDRLHAMCMG